MVCAGERPLTPTRLVSCCRRRAYHMHARSENSAGASTSSLIRILQVSFWRICFGPIVYISQSVAWHGPGGSVAAPAFQRAAFFPPGRAIRNFPVEK